MITNKRKSKNYPRFVSLIIAGTGLVSLYQGYRSSQQAADYAEEQTRQQQAAIEAQRRAANIDAQKARIQQQREARIARARIIAQSTAAGMGPGTSGVAGAVGSIGSQTAANIGAINVAQSFAEAASNANVQAAAAAGAGAQAQAKAAQWQTLADIGFSAFNQIGGGWSGLFSKPVKGAAAQRTVSSTEFLTGPKQYTFGK